MFARLENGVVAEYPYTLQQLQAAHPSVSLALPITDASLAPFEVVLVEAVPKPVETDTYDIAEGTPALDNGVWKQTWVQVSLTPQELARRAAATAKRNAVANAQADAKNDNAIQQLGSMTNAQIIAYVNSTPTNQVLAKILMVLRADIREKYID